MNTNLLKWLIDDPALFTKEDLKKKDNMIKELGGTAYKIN